MQKAVRKILADVRKRGDAAVRAYTKKFDGVLPRQYAVTCRRSSSTIPPISCARCEAARPHPRLP